MVDLKGFLSETAENNDQNLFPKQDRTKALDRRFGVDDPVLDCRALSSSAGRASDAGRSIPFVAVTGVTLLTHAIAKSDAYDSLQRAKDEVEATDLAVG